MDASAAAGGKPKSAGMDLCTLYERLLSLSPDLARAARGELEPELGWGSRSPWSPSLADLESPSPPRASAPLAPRLPGRSTSLVESRAWVPPPPGFEPLPPRAAPAATAAPSEGAPGSGSPAGAASSSRYKTELCRTFSESGKCRYGSKCQFAHGLEELRPASRHPKYKTELCRKFLLLGACPYGTRCHFIHTPYDVLSAGSAHPPLLRQSLSFSGMPSARRRGSPTLSPPGLPDLPSPLGFFSPPSSPPPLVTTPGEVPFSPSAFSAAPGPVPRGATAGETCCPSCRQTTGAWGPTRDALGLGLGLGLARSPSAHSLGSEPDDQASSGGSSLGGSDSPVFEVAVGGAFAPSSSQLLTPVPPRRLPIFNRLSVSD
ncbi:mRNA decay activator protein ZFP36 [Antechinus flavipes]|uniref:mRNA decay activator protein ZFP36 n=1 Tax=Antechinus flavipes TaxID=38775 RepID=UPI002236BD6D|nr:mRNA decay activator protein ZFP36 [Antechinus flavipes]